jgi:hypothetical protein
MLKGYHDLLVDLALIVHRTASDEDKLLIAYHLRKLKDEMESRYNYKKNLLEKILFN